MPPLRRSELPPPRLDPRDERCYCWRDLPNLPVNHTLKECGRARRQFW